MIKVTVGHLDFDGISTTETICDAGTYVVSAIIHGPENKPEKLKSIKKKNVPVAKQDISKPKKGYIKRIKRIKKP